MGVFSKALRSIKIWFSALGSSFTHFYLTGKCGLFALKVCFLRLAFCPPNLSVLLLNCLKCLMLLLLPTRLAPSMVLTTKLLPSMVLLSMLLPAVLLKLTLHASITSQTLPLQGKTIFLV